MNASSSSAWSDALDLATRTVMVQDIDTWLAQQLADARGLRRRDAGGEDG